jgi:C-terminal processing protease CtpA/Prc
MIRTLARLGALALLAAPLPVLAQDVVSSRGWIGISFVVESTGTAAGVRTIVRIDSVNEGSPAQGAGLRAGDHLVKINHISGPDSLLNLVDHLHLDPGDPVSLVIMRNGRRQELMLHAADRAERPETTSTFTFSFQADSMVETMVRAMDSLRIRLVEANGDVSVIAQGGESNIRLLGPATQVRIRASVADAAPPLERLRSLDEFANTWIGRDVQAPFAFGLFRSEQHDSLEGEMDGLNRLYRELRAREGERLRQIMSSQGGILRVVDQNDPVLSHVRETLVELTTESRRLRKAMDNAARQNGSAVYVRSAPRVAGFVPDAAEPTREAFSPLAPYLLGENRVAGAEVMDVSSDLAEALQVEGGVLVLEVSDGTPAAVAGIRAGDVITRIDQVTVRSVDDLRIGLSRASAETPVTLIRRGTSRQVLLRR